MLSRPLNKEWHGTAFAILAVCWVKEVVFYKHSTVVMEWMVWCVPSGPIKLIHTYIYHWKLMLTFILGLNLDFKRSFQLAETSGSFFTFKYEIRWPLPLSFLSESLNPTVFNVHRKGWRDERKHITKNRKRGSLTISISMNCCQNASDWQWCFSVKSSWARHHTLKFDAFRIESFNRNPMLHIAFLFWPIKLFQPQNHIMLNSQLSE